MQPLSNHFWKSATGFILGSGILSPIKTHALCHLIKTAIFLIALNMRIIRLQNAHTATLTRNITRKALLRGAKAITEMPEDPDIATVDWLLEMCIYLDDIEE